MKEAFQLWRKSFPDLLKWVVIPAIALGWILGYGGQQIDTSGHDLAIFLAFIFFSVVIAHITHAHRSGLSITNPYTSVLPLLLPALGFWILYTTIVFLGFLLFLIPGIIWGVTFFWGDEFVVAYRMSPAQALQTSRRLVKGRWWRVLFFQWRAGLLTGVLFLGLFVPLVIFMMLFQPFHMEGNVPNALVTAYYAGVIATVYGFGHCFQVNHLHQLLSETSELNAEILTRMKRQ